MFSHKCKKMNPRKIIDMEKGKIVDMNQIMALVIIRPVVLQYEHERERAV